MHLKYNCLSVIGFRELGEFDQISGFEHPQISVITGVLGTEPPWIIRTSYIMNYVCFVYSENRFSLYLESYLYYNHYIP